MRYLIVLILIAVLSLAPALAEAGGIDNINGVCDFFSDEIVNGDMEIGDPPTGYTTGGAGATFAQSGTSKVNDYSYAITRNGANCQATQNIGWDNSYQGKTCTVGAWIWCDTANTARVYAWDGVGATGDYHAGDSQWEWCTATHVIDGAASELEIGLKMYNNNTTAYFDYAVLSQGTYTAYDETRTHTKTINGIATEDIRTINGVKVR